MTRLRLRAVLAASNAVLSPSARSPSPAQQLTLWLVPPCSLASLGCPALIAIGVLAEGEHRRDDRSCKGHAPRAPAVPYAVCYALEGWMSEWFKVPVLKTGAFQECRGFESLSIRFPFLCTLQLLVTFPVGTNRTKI